jgi:uncharacterized MnhB-related membrane protein
MKYDWPSRVAVTLAVSSVTAYLIWLGLTGHSVAVMRVGIILLMAPALLVWLKNRGLQFVLMSGLLSVGTCAFFIVELMNSPVSIYTAFSGTIFVINVGVLVFLLKTRSGTV